MTTIRPDLLPPSHQGPRPQDSGKLAAQRAFFAAALGQAQGAVGTAGPAGPTPAQSVAAAPAPAPARATVAPSAEAPQKVLRPGSIIDIRV